MSLNLSDSLSTENQPKEEPIHQDAMFVIRRYALPIICFLGLIGNSLSAKAFLGPGMRHASCSLYLAVRSMSDNFFILTLFIAWLDFVDVRLFHTDGICQVVIFMSYTFSFVSVWCVVFVTVENYIRICHHTKVNQFCTTTVSRFISLVIILLALVIYNFPLWGTQVQVLNGESYCLTKKTFGNFQEILTYIDTVLTLIIPIIVILILMMLILISSVDAEKRHRRLTLQVTSPDIRRRTSPHSKVTRLLSSVTVMFLILHTPSHVIRLKVLFEHLLNTTNKATGTDMDRTLQHVFIIMYYLNFSFNCVVYFVCGRNFRKVFIYSFCKYCSFRYVEEDNEMLSNGGTTSYLFREDEHRRIIEVSET